MNNGVLKSNISLSSLQKKPQFFILNPISQTQITPITSQNLLKTPAETFNSEDEFDEEFEEDEDVIVPLSNMRQWTRNKPRGFGEGKVYDTSLEDKLMEELEHSRVAQLANINNLKNNPQDGNPNSKKVKLPKQKDPEVVPNGIRVHLVNLPKKKNIHRDLQAAFKLFTGIINIIPAVSGNEKTREPVCKGFAFVDFKSEKEANSSSLLVRFRSKSDVKIMKPGSPNTASIKPAVHRIKSPLPVLNVTTIVNSNPGTETTSDPYVEDAAFDMLKIGDDLELATSDYNDNNFGKSDIAVEEKHEPEAGSESLEKQKKVRENGTKMTRAKKKVESTPKLNIPGSASRLKTKEKPLLYGVFSKYGCKSSDQVK